MKAQANVTTGAYLAKGTIGNVGTPGAPIVLFSLVVVPEKHHVSGTVEIRQAAPNGNYSGQVQGTIYSTGLPPYTQLVSLRGLIHPDNDSIAEINFEASMATDAGWKGIGGFNYANVHVEDVPVTPIK